MSADLARRLKAQAHRLGFDLVGITTADPPPHLDVFRRWLAQGLHGDMAYLARERNLLRRADPHAILPEARSILVLGVRYPAPESAPPPAAPLTGRVAAYAWGEDYHDVLLPRLQALVDFLHQTLGHEVPYRAYTDTGPLLERDLAQRAGLGWIGRNTCLIAPGRGSCFLLAEILLGYPLPPDPPFRADRCGSCTRCLEACPTRCIRPDRTLDARRCIAYLTIEHRGSIPPDLRPQIGEWVFGCDVCQQVCPWNRRFATPHGDPAFAPRPGLPHLNLPDILSLDAAAFNRRFRGSPIRRARRRGLLRNAAVVLGNRRDPRAVPALVRALADVEPLVREHAAWALGRIATPAARQALAAALQHETDPQVRAGIRSALEAPPAP